MKRTALALAGFTLTQCAILAGAVALPLCAQAQAPRPNIAETLPPVTGRKNYAQDLVDRYASRHPELIELDIHAVPPGASESVIVASKSRDRIGKRTDSDDLEVAKTGTPRVEINKTGNNNVEVAVQLQDVTGRPVGSVEMTFPYVAGTDENALVKKAEEIRDELRRRIAYGSEDLVTPAQYDAKVPVDTYAQFLVDDTLQRQPGVLVTVLHIKDPKSPDYPIIASSIGRIGKAADASDLEVIRGGVTRSAVSADGKRLEVKLPMRDGAGNVVGAVAIVFPSHIADRDSLMRQAEKIRDDLQRSTVTLGALYGPYPASRPVELAQA